MLEWRDQHVHTKGCIKRFEDATRDGVDLNGCDLTVFGQGRGHSPHKMPNTCSRLQYTSTTKSQTVGGLPDRLDDVDFGVMAVVHRRSRGGVVRCWQFVLERLCSCRPVRVTGLQVEGCRDAAPAGEAQQLLAL